jgi:hypothetical protein
MIIVLRFTYEGAEVTADFNEDIFLETLVWKI